MAVVVSVVVGCFSIGVFVVFIGVNEDDDDFVVAVVSVVAVVISIIVGWFSVCVFFEGDFFFFPFVTWVHPSSSLSGWSPESGFEISLISWMIFADIVVVVVVLLSSAVLLLFWWSFEGRTLKSAPVACNSNIGVFCLQRPPSLFALRSLGFVGWPETPSYLTTWLRSSPRVLSHFRI